MKKLTSKLTRRPLLASLIVTASVAFTVVACGHGHRMSPKVMERMVLGHVDDVMDDIDATDAQRATFEKLAGELLADGLAMKQEHKAHKKEMLALLGSPSPDREAIKAHLQDKIDRMEAFALRSVDKVLDAYETLDPEQQQIVLDKLAKHMENH